MPHPRGCRAAPASGVCSGLVPVAGARHGRVTLQCVDGRPRVSPFVRQWTPGPFPPRAPVTVPRTWARRAARLFLAVSPPPGVPAVPCGPVSSWRHVSPPVLRVVPAPCQARREQAAWDRKARGPCGCRRVSRCSDASAGERVVAHQLLRSVAKGDLGRGARLHCAVGM